MRVSKMVWMVCILSIIALVAGCKSTNTNSSTDLDMGKELIVAYPSQPPSLDTHTNTTTATSNIGKNIFESLVAMDSNYGVQPMLADSWEVKEDGRVIEFKLRKGVKFHNGETMTSKDVVASMNRWLENSSSAEETFDDASFSEIDDHTVKLEMSQPTSTALVVLAYSGGELASIMPASVIENIKGDKLTEFIGTGPFQFESWQQDQQIHLKKFKNYSSREEAADGLSGKKEALVDDLYFKFVADSSTRLAGIQSGEYDVAHSIPYDSTDQLKSNPNVKLYSSPNTILNIYLNKKKGLFSDLTARKALATGINKEAILKASFGDSENYEKTHHMMMYHQEGQWSSDIGKKEYNIHDVEKAKELFKKAGYNGETLKIMATRDYEYVYSSAVVLQEQLNQMGINAEVEVYDWPTFVDKRDDPDNYDITIIPNTAKPEPSSLAFMRSDFTGWTDSEELNAILEEFRRAPSLEDAPKKYNDLQAWFIDYIPIIKIGDINSIYASRDNISEIEYVDGAIYWNVTKSK
ncbi:ABC transporter substrate-binding protein [Siminovitchia terrae]|uniref:ABC transporter substrate-binding protein n=1 Tax=Siminovitchia terrae TaxID=1914933 RepID=UPI0028A88E16|nr:ABC transporter substrate-binding protein [Siminovitchia terrae]